MAEEKGQTEQWLEVTPYRRGGRKLAHICNLLTAAAKVRLVPELIGRIEKAEAGFVIRLDCAAILREGGGGTPGTAVVAMFHFKSSQSDWLTCRTWDGSSEGGTDIYIVKPQKLRGSIVAEHIDTVDVTYDTFNADFTERIAHAATYADEVHRILPRFLVDDIIFAATVDGGTGVVRSGTELTYLDLNVDARMWDIEPI